MKSALLITILLSLMVACTPMPGNRSDPEQEPPGGSSPTSEQGTTELPEVVLHYSREGGIAGFCDQLEVGLEEVHWESCRGERQSAPLDEATREQLVQLATRYAPFSNRREGNPEVSDNMVQSIEFMGIGKEEVSSETEQELYDLASRLLGDLWSRGAPESNREPSAPVTADEALAEYRRLVEGQPDPTASTEIERALLDGLRAYAAAADFDIGGVMEEELLAALGPGGGLGEPAVSRIDLTGDGNQELLIATGVMGVPLVVVSQAGGASLFVLRSGWERIDEEAAIATIGEVDDLTGDGVAELLALYSIPGASALTTNMRAFTFREGEFVPIFEEQLTNWAGGGDWHVEPNSDIITTCAAFGAFDHKLLPHPLQIRHYRYDEGAGVYTLASLEQEPPQSRRQAINEAEAALQQGDLVEAVARYEAAAAGEYSSTGEDPNADWRALAHLRLAMLYMLLGEETKIQPALDRAAGAAALEGLVETMEQGYAQDGTVGAWAALSNVPVYEQMFYPEPDGLHLYSTKPSTLRLSGYGPVAFLAEDPTAIQLSEEELMGTMGARGLPVTALAIGDLDEDGAGVELVVQLSFDAPEEMVATQRVEEIWLLDHVAGEELYHARLLNDVPGYQLEGMTGSPPLVVVRPEEEGMETLRYTWDGMTIQTVTEERQPLPATDRLCTVQ